MTCSFRKNRLCNITPQNHGIPCTPPTVCGLLGLVEGPDTTDLELMGALGGPFGAQGRAALAELYRRHAPSVRGFLERFQGIGSSVVEDHVQETFLTARIHSHRFEHGSALPWLLAIALRRVRDSRRSEKRRKTRETQAARAWNERAEGRDTRPHGAQEDVEDLLARLPEKERVVLELRFVQDLDFQDVANVLGVALRTAKEWSKNALDNLRAQADLAHDPPPSNLTAEPNLEEEWTA